MTKIHFVTDSASDLPDDVINRYNITVIPAFANYGGQSYADDGKALDRVKYYHDLPGMTSHPTTAAMPPALAEEMIGKAFEGCDHLVIICTPPTLSGIYNSMRLGASGLPQDRVTQIDSTTLTMGMGYQVMFAAETAEQTNGDLKAVLDTIERVRRNQRVYAAPESMEFLRRSGRVSWAAAGAAALLQIKPVVLASEGKIESIARVRTFSKAIDKLVELAQEQVPLERLTIVHANNEAGAQEVKSKLGSAAPADTRIAMVTPTIGTHIGPGALGVTTLKQGWRTS